MRNHPDLAPLIAATQAAIAAFEQFNALPLEVLLAIPPEQLRAKIDSLEAQQKELNQAVAPFLSLKVWPLKELQELQRIAQIGGLDDY